ncbi:MAG: hypothetical protein ACLSX2_06715 [Christensenellaceae bacterium]
MANYYTTGYQQAVTDAGYTTSDQVKSLQQQLNAQGAGLSVDGIWGPKTDAAYQRYGAAAPVNSSSDYLSQLTQMLEQKQSAAYDNPYTQQLLDLVKPKDDEAYRQQAEAALRPGLNAQLEALSQSMDDANQGYERNKAELQRQAEASRQQLDADYADLRGDLETAALRRGMGRSSYLTDNLAYLGAQQARAQSNVESQLAQDLKDIGEAQALAQQHYQQTVQRLQDDMLDDLASYESALREKDKSAAQQAYQTLMASYDAYQRYQQQDILDLTTQLYAIAVQREADAAAAAAAAASASSSRTASSRKKAASGSTKKSSGAKAAPTVSQNPQRYAFSAGDARGEEEYRYMNHPTSPSY